MAIFRVQSHVKTHNQPLIRKQTKPNTQPAPHFQPNQTKRFGLQTFYPLPNISQDKFRTRIYRRTNSGLDRRTNSGLGRSTNSELTRRTNSAFSPKGLLYPSKNHKMTSLASFQHFLQKSRMACTTGKSQKITHFSNYMYLQKIMIPNRKKKTPHKDSHPRVLLQKRTNGLRFQIIFLIHQIIQVIFLFRLLVIFLLSKFLWVKFLPTSILGHFPTSVQVKFRINLGQIRHVAMGGLGGAIAPPKVILAPPREIWEVFVTVAG